MRIIAWVNKNSGPSYHRVIMPLLLMPDVDVFVTNNLLEEHFDKGCDVFMYNRTLPDHADAKVAELKQKHGFATCVDVDDYWHLDEHHVLYPYYQEIDFAKLQVRHIADADIVFTTNPRLRNEIRQLNKNVHVLPNAIPPVGQFAVQHDPFPLTRLFWQGSATHQADIEILRLPMGGLQDIAHKVKMVMAGFHPDEPVWNLMARAYTSDLRHQYKLIPSAHVTSYYAAYAEADICLVPLLETRFNGFKSNLKILEAANMGLPVIASRVDPYLDMPVTYCETGGDWVTQIRRMVHSRKRQRESGERLKEFCDLHFNFEKINDERMGLLKYAASGR